MAAAFQLAFISALAIASEAHVCCAPKDWSATVGNLKTWEFQNAQFSNSYKSAYFTAMDAEEGEYTFLDYTTGIAYDTLPQSCTKRRVPGLLDFVTCIPDDAELLRSIMIEATLVHFYRYSLPNNLNVTMSVGVDDDCFPFGASGSVGSENLFTHVYYNVRSIEPEELVDTRVLDTFDCEFIEDDEEGEGEYEEERPDEFDPRQFEEDDMEDE